MADYGDGGEQEMYLHSLGCGVAAQENMVDPATAYNSASRAICADCERNLGDSCRAGGWDSYLNSCRLFRSKQQA